MRRSAPSGERGVIAPRPHRRRAYPVMNPVTALQLAEWRRETAALYARVRDQADPAAAHALWRDGRGRLLRSHPQSPLPPGDPMRVRGVPYWPYDPALRWTVPVEPVTRPQRLARS